MKIIAKREVILAPLQAVIGVVERRQTMPILANVLLAAKGGQLSVTATDLEVELVASAQVDVQRNGEITVPGRKLLDICRALPEGAEITLTLEGERMLLRAKRSRFTLSTLPAAEFPTVEEINRAADAQGRAEGFQAPAGQDAFLDGPAGRAVLPEWTVAGNVGENAANCRD